MKEFRLSLDVTVTKSQPGDLASGQLLSSMVNDALQEVTNRRDFRAGQIAPGRVLKYSYDFDSIVVTVDLTRMHVE